MLTKIQTVDEFLGNSQKRYFGEGHKYSSYAIHLARDATDFSHYSGTVLQEKAWSVKDGLEMTPHLSTIDAIILSIMAIEKKYEKSQPEWPLSRYYLSSFQIKAGNAAEENLENIQIELLQEERVGQEKIAFWLKVGQLHVQCALELLPESVQLKSQNKTGANYLENHLKAVTHQLTNIQITPNYEIMSDIQTVRSVKAKTGEGAQGLNSLVATHMSLIEWLIIFAQLSQVEAYHHDALERDQTDVYWMRQVSAAMDKNYFLEADPQVVIGRIDDVKILKFRQEEWHVFKMSGESIDQLVTFSGNLAHKVANESSE